MIYVLGPNNYLPYCLAMHVCLCERKTEHNSVRVQHDSLASQNASSALVNNDHFQVIVKVRTKKAFKFKNNNKHYTYSLLSILIFFPILYLKYDTQAHLVVTLRSPRKFFVYCKELHWSFVLLVVLFLCSFKIRSHLALSLYKLMKSSSMAAKSCRCKKRFYAHCTASLSVCVCYVVCMCAAFVALALTLSHSLLNMLSESGSLLCV